MDRERYTRLIALNDAGKPDQALPGLEELAASTDDPEDKAAILLAVAACQRDLGKAEDARNTLLGARRLADKKSPIQPRLVFQGALSKVPEGDWRGVLADLDFINREYSSILSEPENQDLAEEVGRYRGMALYRLGRETEARPFLEKAAKLEYLRARTLYYLGLCYYKLGDLFNAKDSLRKALGLDLDADYEPDAHYVLGLAYYWSGQSARAVPELEWCLQNDREERSKRSVVITALVSAYKALGQENEVERFSRMLEEGRHK